jgi:glycine/D-amino acid oxidase-like deaminating enzyme
MGLFAELLKEYGDRFTIEAQTPAQKIHYDKDGSYRIQTPRGITTTKTLIHATNGYAGCLLPGLRGPLFPLRGQMTTHRPTQIAKKYAGKRSWSLSYDTGFDYIIQNPTTNEIFAGGGLAQAYGRGISEFGTTDDSIQSTLALAHLGGSMNAVFGIEEDKAMTAGVKAAWTGIMGFTSDGVPLVGRLPSEATQRDGNGEWIAAGFNGYGMVNAWLCGKAVADRVLQREEPEPIPKAYEISSERLKGMSAEDGARQWVSVLGLE